MFGLQVELNKCELLVSIGCSRGWHSMPLCELNMVKLELRNPAQAKQGYFPFIFPSNFILNLD